MSTIDSIAITSTHVISLCKSHESQFKQLLTKIATKDGNCEDFDSCNKPKIRSKTSYLITDFSCKTCDLIDRSWGFFFQSSRVLLPGHMWLHLRSPVLTFLSASAKLVIALL